MDIFDINELYDELPEADTPDIYCFGFSERMWEDIGRIQEDLPGQLRRQIALRERESVYSDKNIVFLSFNPGWNTKYLCVILPEGDSCETMSENYLARRIRELHHFSRNQNYKHIPYIQLYADTFPVEKELLEQVIREQTDGSADLITLKFEVV